MTKMSKIFSFLIFLIFCFKSIFALNEIDQKFDFIKIDEQRVAIKRDHYKDLFAKSKNFRAGVYFLSGVAGVGLVAYVGYKIWESNNFSNSNNKTRRYSSGGGSVFDRFGWLGLKKDIWKNEGIKGLCKYGLVNGVADGIYLGVSAVFVSAFLAVYSNAFASLKEKFLKKWNDSDHEIFINSYESIQVFTKQLESFFDGEVFCEKDEFLDIYSVFINSLENLIALTIEVLEKENNLDSFVQDTLISSQKLLVLRVNEFADNLKTAFKQSDSRYFDKELSENLTPSFVALNNQIFRFLTLFYSVAYEEKQ